MLGALAPPMRRRRGWCSDRIAHEMSEWSGLDVAIAAAPEISVWPDLQANLTGVSLSRPGSAGKAPVITAERVEIELSALAAIGGGVDFSRRASSSRPSE